MESSRGPEFRALAPIGCCLIGLAACTWLSFHFGQGFAFTGFLYLVFVVVTALYGGFWHATVISIAAAACLNYFFVPPIFSFVNSPANWVALGAFEFTALVISRLSLQAQRESHAQAARQAEELRTAVLDALAHQFKTPLAIVRSASSGLLAIGGLPELQTDLVTSIDQQAAKLDQLASRLLRAARLEAMEFKPRREQVMFSRLAHTAIQRLDQQPDRERFRVVAPQGEVPVFADPELILTSISHLVDNAIQYSEPASPIDMFFAMQKDSVVLKVRSKGLVVRADQRKRIFQRFYRAPESQHVLAGTGLGLSITKKIVEAHHGDVWAEGEQNYGTSFSISLPVAPAA